MISYTIHPHAVVAPFPHYWETCVGSGHAALGLRSDWQRDLARCREELGFRYVRFHGLLNDDMSVCLRNPDGTLAFSFYSVDAVFDFLLSIGMKPFLELSFMPACLASGSETLFHYKSNVTPPSDYGQWELLIESLAAHLIARYGIDEVAQWYFEVWNEPNLGCFFAGSQADYFTLYQHTAQALKRTDPRLRVGGPATANNRWIPELRQFCEQNHVPLDFISTHHYPTDVALGHWMDMEESMANSYRGAVTDMCRKARQEAGAYPLFYTEWNNSPSCRDSYHDLPFAAAFLVKSIVDNSGLADIYSFWTFDDIFEENGFPSTLFHGGFGLLGWYGLPKPSYHAFRLLHRLGEERLSVDTEGEAPTVECVATQREGEIGILVYNHNIPRSPIQEHAVQIRIPGVSGPAECCIIDETHLNIRAVWEGMGAPPYPDPDQLEALRAQSQLHYETIPISSDGILLRLPPHSVVGLFIPTDKA